MAFAIFILCLQYSAGILAGWSSPADYLERQTSRRNSVALNLNVCFAFWAASDTGNNINIKTNKMLILFRHNELYITDILYFTHPLPPAPRDKLSREGFYARHSLLTAHRSLSFPLPSSSSPLLPISLSPHLPLP